VSEDTEGGLTLASHYLDVDRPERALEALAGLGGAALQDDGYWVIQAQALLDLDRFEDARRAAEEGLRLDSDSIVLLALAAAADARLGYLDDAERHLLTALRLEPESTFLLTAYADVLMRGGAVQKAERVLDRADRISADDPDVTRARIALAYIRGDDRDAERHSRRLLAEFDPEDPGAHAMLGLRATNRGAFRRASEHFDTAARYDLSDQDSVELAREGRVYTHPLFWPLWPFQRFGPWKFWGAAIGVFAVLAALELYTLLVIAWVTYMALVVYSWTVPPLAERWLKRRQA
jgi:tetratricopeptide (TPR) repeat protein